MSESSIYSSNTHINTVEQECPQVARTWTAHLISFSRSTTTCCFPQVQIKIFLCICSFCNIRNCFYPKNIHKLVFSEIKLLSCLSFHSSLWETSSALWATGVSAPPTCLTETPNWPGCYRTHWVATGLCHLWNQRLSHTKVSVLLRVLNIPHQSCIQNTFTCIYSEKYQRTVISLLTTCYSPTTQLRLTSDQLQLAAVSGYSGDMLPFSYVCM